MEMLGWVTPALYTLLKYTLFPSFKKNSNKDLKTSLLDEERIPFMMIITWVDE